MPRNETPGDMWVGKPEGENCWEDEETMEDGRRSSAMAAAIRIRLPKAGMSSSLRRLASSSSRTSPEISCSVVKIVSTNGSFQRFRHLPLNLSQILSSKPFAWAQDTTSSTVQLVGGLAGMLDERLDVELGGAAAFWARGVGVVAPSVVGVWTSGGVAGMNAGWRVPTDGSRWSEEVGTRGVSSGLGVAAGVATVAAAVEVATIGAGIRAGSMVFGSAGSVSTGSS